MCNRETIQSLGRVGTPTAGLSIVRVVMGAYFLQEASDLGLKITIRWVLPRGKLRG